MIKTMDLGTDVAQLNIVRNTLDSLWEIFAPNGASSIDENKFKEQDGLADAIIAQISSISIVPEVTIQHSIPEEPTPTTAEIPTLDSLAPLPGQSPPLLRPASEADVPDVATEEPTPTDADMAGLDSLQVGARTRPCASASA